MAAVMRPALEKKGTKYGPPSCDSARAALVDFDLVIQLSSHGWGFEMWEYE